MRHLTRLIGLLLIAAVVSAQSSPEPSAPATAAPSPSAPALSPLCENAFTHAVRLLPSPDPGAVADPSPDADPTHLDVVIQRCPSLAEWLGGTARYPELLGGADPLAFLEARCTDPASGLSRYSACVSLVQALATPPPTPRPTPVPDASSIPSGAPVELYTDVPPEPATTAPRSGRSSVPDGKVPVPGAAKVRYFRVAGETYDELMRSIGKKTRRFCGRRGMIACVVPLDWRFTTQTTQDPETGACSISGLNASVGYLAHIPRWMEPDRVSAPLAWWWRQVAIRAGWRQTQHVRILEEHLATLQDQVVGQPCAAFDGILDAWVAELEQAQADFAARDDALQEQAIARWLREAGGA
jgi:hypothetical protein